MRTVARYFPARRRARNACTRGVETRFSNAFPSDIVVTHVVEYLDLRFPQTPVWSQSINGASLGRELGNRKTLHFKLHNLLALLAQAFDAERD